MEKPCTEIQPNGEISRGECGFEEDDGAQMEGPLSDFNFWELFIGIRQGDVRVVVFDKRIG